MRQSADKRREWNDIQQRSYELVQPFTVVCTMRMCANVWIVCNSIEGGSVRNAGKNSVCAGINKAAGQIESQASAWAMLAQQKNEGTFRVMGEGKHKAGLGWERARAREGGRRDVREDDPNLELAQMCTDATGSMQTTTPIPHPPSPLLIFLFSPLSRSFSRSLSLLLHLTRAL